jgi:hypothetical protein
VPVFAAGRDLTPVARERLDLKHIFLSRYVHRTYNAYVLSQFKKIEQDLRNSGEVRWKYVMHLIRLLLSGVVILREGFVPLEVGEYRDRANEFLIRARRFAASPAYGRCSTIPS